MPCEEISNFLFPHLSPLPQYPPESKSPIDPPPLTLPTSLLMSPAAAQTSVVLIAIDLAARTTIYRGGGLEQDWIQGADKFGDKSDEIHVVFMCGVD